MSPLIQLLPQKRSMILAATLLIAATQVRAVIIPATPHILDLNSNGISDVWELVYGAEGLDPDADSDGDGLINRLEAIAGTNPFDARSVPRITPFNVTTNGARVSMAGDLGKHYQLQASEILCGVGATNWFSEADMVARTNTVATFNSLPDRPSKFFRIMVSDVDTDGDGVSDWEEYQLGLDPLSASSNGQTDAQGNPLSDYNYAANWLGTVHGTRPQPANAIGGNLIITSVAVYPDSTPTGTGLTGYYYTNSSTTYTNVVNFNPTNLFLTTNDAVVDFRWGPATTPNLSNGFYTVRWVGQVEPQYSELYTFETRSDDGAKLWVNDQLLIDHWQTQGTTSWTNSISLQAGVRYNIRMEYLNRGGTARASLYWYSQSQARQIIPAIRLYPESNGLAPGAITSPLDAMTFLGQPFTYTITAANSPLSFGASNVPPGLVFNPTNAVISGIPTLGGEFDITLSATNAVGGSEAILHLTVIDTGSAVTREVWLGAPGAGVTNIPLNLIATNVSTLGNLEGTTNFGDNYGERIRGYLTAPVTGNYYFWIAANSAAELWISNDAEPVNKVKRAYVYKPTLPRQWNAQVNQRSAWLTLEAGKRYYIEILHKASTGVDHWAVGWLQDSTGTNTVPSGIVPGYVLSPFTNTPASEVPGTLYSANMVAQAGATSTAVGSATLRLSADGSQAVLKFSYGGFATAVTARHIHADAYLGKNAQGQIIFDIDTATQEPDGSYIWQIAPSGPLTAADIVEIIKQGKSYLNVHTVDYPAGEINGHFGLTDGTANFTPPPLPPVWFKDHSNSNAAARFLLQATLVPARRRSNPCNPSDMKAGSTDNLCWLLRAIWQTSTSSVPRPLTVHSWDTSLSILGGSVP